jgi:peptide/nickel transport system permease protein
MTAYILRRVAQMPLVIALVTIVVFVVMHLLPGDPVYAIIGQSGNVDQAEIAALRQQYGLNDPVPVQYIHWVGDVLHGDFGRSSISRTPIGPQLLDRIPVTAQLGVASLLVAVLIGIPAGTLAAIRRNSWIDMAVTVVAMVGIAVPSFWLSMLLIWLFVVSLGWLPATGFVGVWNSPLAALRFTLLPAAALGLTLAGSVMRYTRSSVLEVLNQDYVRTARAKGLHERGVVVRHVLRNSMLPVITILGLQLGAVLAGSVIIESMFAIPGLGRMAVTAISGRDYPSLQAVVLFFTVVVLGVNLLTDIVYALIDPRIRYA